MPEEKFPTPEVNLLAADEFEDQTQGKFLRWALTWGKRIVVLTELVVILAFLSRFWLDTTVADLNEKITRNKAIIQSTQESEKRFRTIAARINKATNIEDAVSVLTVYDKTQALIPAEIFMKQISITRTDFAFSGSSDETTLGRLVKAFRDSKSFSNVSVDRISKQITGQKVDFALKATYVSK